MGHGQGNSPKSLSDTVDITAVLRACIHSWSRPPIFALDVPLCTGMGELH